MEAIRASGKRIVAHRNGIDADSGRDLELPVVGRNTGHDGLLMEGPPLPYAAVLDPKLGVGSGERVVDIGILNEHSGMGLHLVMHNLALVDDPILNVERGGQQFAAGAIVVELATGKRQDGHTQAIEFLVGYARMLAKRQAEFGIHIVEGKLTLPVRALHQQLDGTVAQQPDADVHEEKVSLQEAAQFLDRGFLQHEVELVGGTTGRHEDAVVLRQVGIDPQTVAHDIGFGYLLQRLGGADIHVATGNERVQGIGSLLHNLFVKGKLQGKEVLRKTLPPGPSEDRNGCQHFTRRSIARQATALPTSMQQDALFAT